MQETLFDVASDGETKLVSLLQKQGIIPGIKVDKGVQPLFGTDNETVTQGIDDLGARCAKYYAAGARFAKWRAVLNINDSSGATPSQLSIKQNAETLARYAVICQANGLVPIVEPEVLMDGEHSVEFAQKVTEKVIAACYKELQDHGAFLEGTLLKPNMVRSGESNKSPASPVEIAASTVRCLQRTVPHVAAETNRYGKWIEQTAIGQGRRPKVWVDTDVDELCFFGLIIVRTLHTTSFFMHIFFSRQKFCL